MLCGSFRAGYAEFFFYEHGSVLSRFRNPLHISVYVFIYDFSYINISKCITLYLYIHYVQDIRFSDNLRMRIVENRKRNNQNRMYYPRGNNWSMEGTVDDDFKREWLDKILPGSSIPVTHKMGPPWLLSFKILFWSEDFRTNIHSLAQDIDPQCRRRLSIWSRPALHSKNQERRWWESQKIHVHTKFSWIGDWEEVQRIHSFTPRRRRSVQPTSKSVPADEDRRQKAHQGLSED